MGNITISDICTGIADFLAPLRPGTVKIIQDASQPAETLGGFTEAIQDTPLIQVYWNGAAFDAANGWHQTSFQGGVIQTDLEFMVDVFAAQRAHLSEDMAAVQVVMSPIIDLFHAGARSAYPNFGVAGVQGFSFRAERVTLQNGEGTNAVQFAGGRITVRVRVF